MNISRLLCSPPPSQGSQTGRSLNGAPSAPAYPAYDTRYDDSRSSYSSPTPSNSDAYNYNYKDLKVINRCGNCRQRGHNRKTCPKPEIPKPAPPPTRPRAPGCCGLCGQQGHNRTSCRYGPPPQ